MVEIKSGGDGTLSLAPSLLLSASPRAHHVAPCPIVSLWWSLICICAGTHLATGSLGAGVPLTARVPDGLSVASIHRPQPDPWENSELFLPDLSRAHAFISWCLWPSPLFLNATLRMLPSRLSLDSVQEIFCLKDIGSYLDKFCYVQRRIHRAAEETEVNQNGSKTETQGRKWSRGLTEWIHDGWKWARVHAAKQI